MRASISIALGAFEISSVTRVMAGELDARRLRLIPCCAKPTVQPPDFQLGIRAARASRGIRCWKANVVAAWALGCAT